MAFTTHTHTQKSWAKIWKTWRVFLQSLHSWGILFSATQGKNTDYNIHKSVSNIYIYIHIYVIQASSILG